MVWNAEGSDQNSANSAAALPETHSGSLATGSGLALPFTQKFFLNPRSNRAETDLGKGIAVLNSPAT